MPVRLSKRPRPSSVERDADVRLGRLAIDHALCAQRPPAARSPFRVCSTTPVVIRKQFGAVGSLRAVAHQDAAARSSRRRARGARSPPSTSTKLRCALPVAQPEPIERVRRAAPSTRATCATYQGMNSRSASAARSAATATDVEVEERHHEADRRRAAAAARSARRRACRPGRSAFENVRPTSTLGYVARPRRRKFSPRKS